MRILSRDGEYHPVSGSCCHHQAGSQTTPRPSLLAAAGGNPLSVRVCCSCCAAVWTRTDSRVGGIF